MNSQQNDDMITEHYLLRLMIEKAEAEHDGHLTLMRFTTGWKAFFDTPLVEPKSYDEIGDAEMSDTMAAAIVKAMNTTD